MINKRGSSAHPYEAVYKNRFLEQHPGPRLTDRRKCSGSLSYAVQHNIALHEVHYYVLSFGNFPSQFSRFRTADNKTKLLAWLEIVSRLGLTKFVH